MVFIIICLRIHFIIFIAHRILRKIFIQKLEALCVEVFKYTVYRLKYVVLLSMWFSNF